jgi:hypothetical protein
LVTHRGLVVLLLLVAEDEVDPLLGDPLSLVQGALSPKVLETPLLSSAPMLGLWLLPETRESLMKRPESLMKEAPEPTLADQDAEEESTDQLGVRDLAPTGERYGPGPELTGVSHGGIRREDPGVVRDRILEAHSNEPTLVERLRVPGFLVGDNVPGVVDVDLPPAPSSWAARHPPYRGGTW